MASYCFGEVDLQLERRWFSVNLGKKTIFPKQNFASALASAQQGKLGNTGLTALCAPASV